MSEMSDPYAARPAFKAGDRVEVSDGREWDTGKVIRAYRVQDGSGRLLWVYDVRMDFDASTPIKGVAYLRGAK